MIKRQNFLKKILQKKFCYQPFPAFKKAQDILDLPKTSKNIKKFGKFNSIIPQKLSTSFFKLNLNQQNDNTTLSILSMKRFQQFLDYYQTNTELNTILIKNLDDEYFSMGIDIRFLKKQIQNHPQQILKYFTNFYSNLIFNVSYPKPIIIQLQNKIQNAAIPYFTQFPFCYAMPNTIMQFNSLDYNFIPSGGETFVLKNLPNNLGLYYVLTRQEINVKDMYDLKMIFDIADINEQQEEKLNYFTHTEEMFPLYNETYKSVNKHVLSKRRDDENNISEFLDRCKNENPKMVLLDLFYKKKLIENANQSTRLNNSNEFQRNFDHDFDQKIVENNHLNYKGFLEENIKTIDSSNFQNSEYFRHQKIIFKCFNEDKFENILLNLLQDGSEFALKTHDQLLEISPQLAQISINLLKEVKYCNFMECLEIENKYIKSIVNQNNSKILFQQQNFDSEVFQQEMYDEYMFKQKVNKLIPLKDYYQDFPEAFLCYLNHQPIFNINQIQNYENVVKRSFFRLGIDYSHPSFEKTEALTLINKFFQYQNLIQQRYEDFSTTLSDNFYVQKIFQERKLEILKFFQNQNVEEIIQNLFQKAKKEIQQDKQVLIDKRMKELFHLKFQKEELNELKKTIFQNLFKSKIPNNEINLNLLEINNRVDQLSKEFKIKHNFKEIVQKYKLAQQNKQEQNIELNWDKILFRSDNVSRNDKIEYNFDFSYYMSEHGIPQAEKNYRQRVINELLNFYEQTNRQLNNEEKQKLQEQIQKLFFKDYPEFSNIENFGLEWSQILIDFIPEQKIPKSTKIKIFNKTKNQFDKKNFETKIEELNQIFQKTLPQTYIWEEKSIFSYCQQNEHINKDIKEFFNLIEQMSDTKMISIFKNQVENKYQEGMQKLLNDKDLSNIDQDMKIKLDETIFSIIIPHALFIPLNDILDTFGDIFKMLKQNSKKNISQLGIYNDKLSFQENIQNIDQFLLKSLELIENCSKNLQFESDVIYHKYQQYKKNILKILPQQYFHKLMIENAEEYQDEKISELKFLKNEKEYNLEFMDLFEQEYHILLEYNPHIETYKYMFNINDTILQKANKKLPDQLQYQNTNSQYENLIKNFVKFVENDVVDKYPNLNLRDFSPFIIFRNFYQDFKTMYQDNFVEEQVSFFGSKNDNKLEIYFHDIQKTEQNFSQLQNRGLGGISDQLIKIRDLDMTQEQDINLIQKSSEKWLEKQIITTLKQFLNLKEKCSLNLSNGDQYLINENFNKILKKDYLQKLLMNTLEQDQTEFQKNQEEFLNNKNFSLNFFKKRILQENFKDVEIDLDDNENYHTVKSLFAFSRAIQIQQKNTTVVEQQDSKVLLEKYKQKLENLIDGKKQEKVEVQVPQQRKKYEEQKIPKELLYLEYYQILGEKLEQEKLINISQNIENDIKEVNRKLQIYKNIN